MNNKKEILNSIADQFVASRQSKKALLDQLVQAGERYEIDQASDNACNTFISEISNCLPEITRHDTYMTCCRRQMSVVLGNDMGEVNAYIAAAQRRRNQ